MDDATKFNHVPRRLSVRAMQGARQTYASNGGTPHCAD
jgi:hypothetical protein